MLYVDGEFRPRWYHYVVAAVAFMACAIDAHGATFATDGDSVPVVTADSTLDCRAIQAAERRAKARNPNHFATDSELECWRRALSRRVGRELTMQEAFALGVASDAYDLCESGKATCVYIRPYP